MNLSIDELKRILGECTDEERGVLLDYLKSRLPRHPLEKEWGVGAEICLSWLITGEKKRILRIAPELLTRRVRKSREQT